MVEEGTLGLVRANESPGGLKELDDEPSKDELQHRMETARESISNTVDEIKDTVVNQYESVKETVSQTLDWHEYVKKRPVAWSAGALGAGFLVGYGVAAVVKGPSKHSAPGYNDDLMELTDVTLEGNTRRGRSREKGKSGQGLIHRIAETPAFGRVKIEAGVIGNQFVDEISKKAKDVVLPAAMAWIGKWLEGVFPAKANQQNTSH